MDYSPFLNGKMLEGQLVALLSTGDAMNPELVSKINTALNANNGRVLWADFVETLTDREKHVLHDHLRGMKREGTAKREITMVDGKPVLHIVRMQPAVPESEASS